VNKIGFRMSGGIEGYRRSAEQYSPQIIAMSIFASGALSPKEAIDWVLDEPYVQSMVFGASSRRNIESTIGLINQKLRQPV
jgi:aryl-alcohol dehydrogenase-like predicted oxidoreductase